MAKPALHEAPAGWRPDSPEALQLARWLRSHRLTVLLGAAPDDTTGLLAGGLLPLLGRRSVDTSVQPAPASRRTEGVVVSFQERRRARRARADDADLAEADPEKSTEANAEILILSDAASEPTLASLMNRFEFSARAAGCHPSRPGTRLVQRMQVLSAQHGSRFLFVFDNAAALASPGAEAAGSGAMIDELADVLTAPVDANLVMAWDARYRDQLGPFLDRLGDAMPMILNLAPHAENTVQAPPSLHAAELPEAPNGPPTEPFAGEFDLAFDADAADDAGESQPADTRPPLRPMRRQRHGMPVAAAVALGSVGLLIALGVTGWFATQQDNPPAVATLALEPGAAAIPAKASPAPPATLLVDAEGGPSPRIAAELAAALSAGGPAVITTRPGRFPPLQPAAAATAVSAIGAGPQLALVRYDVLTAAAIAPQAAPFEVIAPLFTDELVVLVNAGSPLQELGDLASARIDAGPPGSARFMAAEALYRDLFGAAPPASNPATTASDARSALQRLAGNSGPDAVLLTGSQARELLPSLSEKARGAIRLLAWPAERTTGRGVMKTYLRSGFEAFGQAPVAAPAVLVFLAAAMPRDDAEAGQLVAIAETLCARLGELKRSGDPKWREVTPGLRLPPLPWRSGAAAAAWSHCTTAPGGQPAESSSKPNQSSATSTATIRTTQGNRP